MQNGVAESFPFWIEPESAMDSSFNDPELIPNRPVSVLDCFEVAVHVAFLNSKMLKRPQDNDFDVTTLLTVKEVVVSKFKKELVQEQQE